MIDFVSLHNQTYYSLLDSLIEPKELFKRAAELNQKAIAITDHGSCAAFWDSWKASKETGVKLIAGCECYFVDNATNTFDKFRHIILLAKNAAGYRNLLTINKKGFDQSASIGKRVYSTVDWKLLEQHSDGLICLTACGNGIISQLLMNQKADDAEKALLKLRDIFGDNLGIEVQPNNMKRGRNIYNDEIEQAFLNRQLINLGKKHNIKVVAACNTHYINKEDADTHDTLLAIGSHQPKLSGFRLKYPVPEFYLKSGDEVKNFFVRNFGEETAQQLCDNSVYFADLCEQPEWIDPKFSNPSGKELAVFPVKDESDYNVFREWVSQQSEDIQKLEEDKLFLRYKCKNAIELLKQKDAYVLQNEQVYLDRIAKEIDVLEYQGFSSYMLIVADYVDWNRRNKLPPSPGRGSVAGCLIAYLLGIHQADSIKYGLIFERFQNKIKIAYPDIDIDISTRNRSRLLNYVKDKYGSDKFCFISNYNTITPKVYSRDMSRAMEFGGSREEAVQIGDDIAGSISEDGAKSFNIDKMLQTSPLFAEYCKKYKELVQYNKILGLPRAASTHAGGIVLSLRTLSELVPLRKDKDGDFCIEYDKDLTEENGFVKMDVLGLSTLDLIQDTLDLIKQGGSDTEGKHLDYDANDAKTYELISAGDTFGVFQLGTSGGTIELCKKIKPKNIEDLAIITTLARPAAASIRADFIRARESGKETTLLHPSLEKAFKKTYGFGLYDESILQLGQDVAGWDLNTADRIRKMIKEKGKHPEKDKKLGEEFVQSAIENGIPSIIANRIWEEQIKAFGSYTFNSSHAIVYSMVSYQTAYLKAHFPVEFLLANLMSETKSNAPNAKANITKFKKELRRHKVVIHSPDINRSQLAYTLQDSNNLITGLDAIKFVGDDAIKDIIAKRPFNDFFDFMVRVSSKSVRANSIQALAAAGALDSFGIVRKHMFLYCSDFRKKLQIWLKTHDPNIDQFIYPFPKEPNWLVQEQYALEQHYLGEAFICKPAIAYKQFFDGNPTTSVQQIKRSKHKTNISSVKVLVKDFFEFRIKKEGKFFGQAMVKAVLEDKNGDQCCCTIFPEQWKEVQKRVGQIHKKAIFDVGVALHFSGSANLYEEDTGIILNQLFNVGMPPDVPADLKAKKINLKKAKSENAEKSKEPQQILDQIEDNLYEEGLIDLDDETADI